ncbi:MAG: hypothetical protein U9Q58_07515 [Pseudomonadota bacterium]|nr:hypothetical protein [Pseudomonadota bacterium]
MFTVNVDATSITITVDDIDFDTNGHELEISDLNDQNNNTGTKLISVGGTLSDPDLTTADFDVDDTSVTINFDNVVGYSGDTIVVTLGYGATSGNDGWKENSDIQTSIDEVDTAIETLRSQAKNLSNNLGTITTREDFTSELINTLHDGADSLTLADINLEGANMLMLQARQSLGTTSLSLSSQASSSVLRLF